MSRQGSACDALVYRVPGNDYPWDSVCARASISSLYAVCVCVCMCVCVCVCWLYVLRHRRSRVLHMIIAAPQALGYSLCQAHTFPQTTIANARVCVCMRAEFCGLYRVILGDSLILLVIVHMYTYDPVQVRSCTIGKKSPRGLKGMKFCGCGPAER
uniref:Uncharacterized protein n=1 Tax=Trichogramma kaykai TaxID=54128 RepID=A0ABD2WFI8_9HYME